MFRLSEKFRVQQPDGSVQGRSAAHALSINRESSYVFLAYAREAANIRLYLIINNQVVAQENDMRWFPAIFFRPQANGQATLWVVSPEDHDVSYTLRIYKWQNSNIAG
jgi:hypothetical protein